MSDKPKMPTRCRDCGLYHVNAPNNAVPNRVDIKALADMSRRIAAEACIDALEYGDLK